MAPHGFNKYFIVIGAGRNKKFVRLTDSERCAHVFGILSLAAQSPRRGYLLITDGEEVAAEEISNEAGGGVTVKVAQAALAKLKRLGVLQRDDEAGAWFVHDWWDVNPDPRVDSTNAERQARYRANSKADSNASNGSSNATVTASNAGEVEVEVEVEGEVEKPATQAARKRARAPIDQTKRPDDFPDALVEIGKQVLSILHKIWDARGGIEPQARNVGLAIMRNDRADHLAVARELDQYMTSGGGLKLRCGDITQRYGDRVTDAPAAARQTLSAVGARGDTEDFGRFDRAAKAKREALEQRRRDEQRGAA